MTVHVIATGGTIASHLSGGDWTNIDGSRLVREAGPHAAEVAVEDIATGPSSNLTVDDMVRIAAHAAHLLAAGADGVVVTHGTDTLELTAFVTSLLVGVVPAQRPIVFTGSMRVHSHPAADGPRNLRDAIAVAADPAALGCGVLVCLEGLLHDPAVVTKTNAASVDAFTSAPFPPAGTVAGERVLVRHPPARRPATAAPTRDVPLLTCYPGIAADEFTRLAAGRRAVVVEAFGDLNVPQQLWGPIHHAWNRGTMVVLASRAFTATTGSEGLALLGAVGAGGLTAQKARLAAMSAIGQAADRDAAVEQFHRLALAYDPKERSTT